MQQCRELRKQDNVSNDNYWKRKEKKQKKLSEFIGTEIK